MKIMRSLESVKTRINQDLMNEIYFTKYMKNKIKENKGDPTKKINIRTEGNEISNETFNNFKSLRKIMKNQAFVLDYDLIQRKIQEVSVSYNEKIFDYSEEIRKIESENKRLVGFEEDLLEKYDSISKEITQKLNIEKQIRMMNYMNHKKIVTHKENVNSLKKFKIICKHLVGIGEQTI